MALNLADFQLLNLLDSSMTTVLYGHAPPNCATNQGTLSTPIIWISVFSLSASFRVFSSPAISVYVNPSRCAHLLISRGQTDAATRFGAITRTLSISNL